MNALHISRRQALAWLGSPTLTGLVTSTLPAAACAQALLPLTVLYRRDTTGAIARTERGAQAAVLALESEFLTAGFQVVQPSPDAYRILDQGPAMMITFARDAGFSMLVSAQQNVRPMPGTDNIVTDVILTCRVFVGHSVAATATARGSMAASAAADVREFAQSESAALAAQKAAKALVYQVATTLKALTPERIAAMSELIPPPVAGQNVPLPVPVATPAPAAAPPQPPLPPIGRKFALVVTVSNYDVLRANLRVTKENLPDLPGVEMDRRNLVSGLQRLGFQRADIVELADADARGDAVRAELGKLVAASKPEDLVLIAVSAHGSGGNEVPSGFGCPVLIDYDPRNRGMLDFWQLQSLVANLPARRTVLVVDTCHAGGVTNMMTTVEISAQGVQVGNGPSRPDPAAIAQAQSHGTRALAVMAAAKPAEVSLEDRSQGGGLFTVALMQGLAERPARTLEAVFRDKVAPDVIRRSTEMCQRMQGCKVQTPLFAFSGLGNQITL